MDGAGQILLPLIGAMRAAGKTVRQLETEITRLLGARYLQSPQVSVALKDAVGQRVTVEGAVKAPGVRLARGQTTLLRILAESGGFTETADQTNVMMFRQTDQGRVMTRYDANAIRVGQAPDPVILGGDTIVVDDFTGKRHGGTSKMSWGSPAVGLAWPERSRQAQAMNYHRLPVGAEDLTSGLHRSGAGT